MPASTTSKHDNLLYLIHRHLKENGFQSAADELQKHVPQRKPKVSASILEIYSSWLDKHGKEAELTVSPKKRQSDAHKEITPSKSIATPATAAQNQDESSEADDLLSQSLLPQADVLPDAKTPKKKGCGTSDKKTVVAVSSAEITATPKVKKKSDSTPVKKTQMPKKEKSVPAKRKRNDSSSAEATVKVKKAKPLLLAITQDDDSDSDSSLDIEKWKNRALQLSEADVAKIETFNALSTEAKPRKPRVRKPRAKKTAEKVEERPEATTLPKASKPRTSRAKKQTPLSPQTAPSHVTAVADTPTSSAPPTPKQTTEKDKTEDRAPSAAETNQISAIPKKKRKKKKSAENEMDVNTGDILQDGAELEKPEENGKLVEKKKKKKSAENEMDKNTGNILQDGAELEKPEENGKLVEKKKKKKKSAENEMDVNTGDILQDGAELEKPEENEKLAEKKKKKKKSAENEMDVNTGDILQDGAELEKPEENEKLVEKKKKKKKKSGADGSEQIEDRNEPDLIAEHIHIPEEADMFDPVTVKKDKKKGNKDKAIKTIPVEEDTPLIAEVTSCPTKTKKKKTLNSTETAVYKQEIAPVQTPPASLNSTKKKKTRPKSKES